MQINTINTQENKFTITISSNIYFKNGKKETLFFELPLSQKNAIVVDSTPFVAALLPLAMSLGENIQVKGTVSKEFMQNIKKAIGLLSSWKVGLYPITITASEIMRDTYKSKKTASFFSAGVDSFYTYLMHKKEITSFVLVHGFDIELTNQSFFNEVNKTVQNVAASEKKSLYTVRTNIKEITDRYVSWDFAHGAALAAIGLLLRGEIKTMYIAGAVRKNQLFPYGTHPKLDPLWSSESIRFKHDGNERTRLEKLADVVMYSDLAMKNLRVCCQNKKGKYNCSTCFKCLNTMIQLICVHALKKAKTFDQKINLTAVRNMYYNYALKYNYFAEANLAILEKEHREPELQEAIRFSLIKSRNPSFIRKTAFFVAKVDKKYNNRRIFNWIFQVSKSEDRTPLFKFLASKGIIK